MAKNPNSAEESKGVSAVDDEYRLTPLKSVEIKAVLEGAIATVAVEMTYVNLREGNPIECTYEFPLQSRTLISQLKVQLGDKVIEAVVQAKEQAQQKYEDVVAGGKLGLLAERVTAGE